MIHGFVQTINFLLSLFCNFKFSFGSMAFVLYSEVVLWWEVEITIVISIDVIARVLCIEVSAGGRVRYGKLHYTIDRVDLTE